MLKLMEITATYGGDYARGGEHPHVTNITDVSERAHTANPPLLLLLGKWLTPATSLLEHSALALQDGASPSLLEFLGIRKLLRRGMLRK